jgi:predicted dehydrogenase
MQKRWRVGLVGVGRGSGYGALFADDPRSEVVAVCDKSSEALERFGQGLHLADDQLFTSYDDFVEHDMDIVFVGTPMPAHCEQTIKAVEAGKHVLSEVTMAPTLEECVRVVDAVRRSGRTYMLAENCIYWPFIQEWKQWASAGRFGEFVYAEAEYLHPIPELIYDRATGERKWRFNRAPLHYCTHSLGPLLEIMGDRIVRAMGAGLSSKVLPEAPVGGIDMQVGLFETEKGALIKLLRTSALPRKPAIHYYTLHGTKGYVETDRGGPAGSGKAYFVDEMDDWQEIDCSLIDTSLPESARQGGHGTAEYGLVHDFLDCLEAGKRAPIDEVRGFEITVPGIIAHESATNGGAWLDVPKAP